MSSLKKVCCFNKNIPENLAFIEWSTISVSIMISQFQVTMKFSTFNITAPAQITNNLHPTPTTSKHLEFIFFFFIFKKKFTVFSLLAVGGLAEFPEQVILEAVIMGTIITNKVLK